MKSFKLLAILVAVLVFSSLVYSYGIGDTPKVKNLAESFAAYYQSGDVDGLMKLYAVSVKANNRFYSQRELKSMSIRKSSGNQGATIRGIVIVGGLDGFKAVSPGKFSGTVTFRVTYEVNGKAKSMDVPVSWTIAKPEGSSDWRIIETSCYKFILR
jgi:hypothetical protein